MEGGPNMKLILLFLILLAPLARANDGTLAINILAHTCIGYLVGSTVSDKLDSAPQEKKERSTWEGTAETVICCALVSMAWIMWRPDTDEREITWQAVGMQVGGQVGLRF